MRHKLKISVSKEPQNGGVVRCRSVTLREKMLTRLLGRKERVMILIPGNTVESLDITELSEGGAACEYARVSVNFYAFNSNGNRGIACGLGNIQKVRDGEPLGGRSSAADDFSTDFDDDFLS